MSDELEILSLKTKRWGYLKDFIAGKDNGEEKLSVIPKIGCMNMNNSTLQIDNADCIKCLFCVAGAHGNINIDKDFNFYFVPSDKNNNHANEFLQKYVEGMFIGKLVSIPKSKKISQNKYKSLRDFIEVNETTHISVLAAGLIKYLSLDEKARLGLEVKMLIKTRDRGGRMDICLLSKNKDLFIFESKVSFEKMMSEGRYLSQITAYKEEVAKTISVDCQDINAYIILLIDGRESDLLFSKHTACTSNVGNQSVLFYNNIEKHKIFFMSFQALWCLTLLKLVNPANKKYSIENVIGKIYKERGLLSAGVVTGRLGKYQLKKIDEYLN